MRPICDYQIIQRDADGFGRALFSGTHPHTEAGVIVARVLREDDNQMILPWQKCERNGDAWQIRLTIPQGGLYRVEARFSANEEHPLHNFYDWSALVGCASHVGVGDVFVMAGQSNMSGYGRDPAYDPPELGVHLFDNRGQWTLATHPLNSVVGSVYCNDDSSSGTSPGLAFGRMMHRRLGVPIGLVAAARGGSALEAWNPAEADCFLYRALEAKMEEVGKCSAILWYQGCSETGDAEEANTYPDKFRQTVGLWRERFGDVPIVVCQINRHAWKGADNDRNWGIVREALRQAGLQIPQVYVVPTLDMHTSDGIHNASGACVVIGERMASVLLHGHYGQAGSTAPTVTHAKQLDARTVLLEFRDKHMLRTMDDLATGLHIEDENGLMRCTKISTGKDGAVTVTAERDIGQNAVFHAYWEREVPSFFIRDIYGMPMLACYGVPVEREADV